MKKQPDIDDMVIAIDKNGKRYKAEYGVLMSGHLGFIDLETDEEIDDVVDWELVL